MIAILALVGVSLPAAALAADESSPAAATVAPLDTTSQGDIQTADAAEPAANGVGDPEPSDDAVGSAPEQVQAPSPTGEDAAPVDVAPVPEPESTGDSADATTPPVPTTSSNSPAPTPTSDSKGNSSDKGDKDDKGDSWHSTPLTLDLEANCCDEWKADGTTITVTAGGLSAKKSYVVTVLSSGTIIETWRIASPKSTSAEKVFVVPGEGSYEVRLVPADTNSDTKPDTNSDAKSGDTKGPRGDKQKGISECIEIPPCPDEPVPSWSLSKAANPASGSVVNPGQDVTYTLTARNTSDVVITDAQATDDLSGVIPEHATLVEPLADGLSLAGTTLTWLLPTLNPGEAAVTVSYVVTVNADQFGQKFDNVVTPGANGECVPESGETDGATDGETDGEVGGDGCTTNHSVIDIDLSLLKTASTPNGEAVDSGAGDLITHTLAITNTGDNPSWRTSIVDTLPLGLTADPSTVVFTPADPDQHWSVGVVDGVMTAQHDGWFQPGQVQSVSFASTVGDLTRGSDDEPFPDLVNNACVVSEQYPDSDVTGPGFDSNPDNNCDTATTPVKSIAVAAAPQCVKDAPSVMFTVTPFNVADPATQPLALIWWTPAAFAERDPSISAGDTAALLADGASQVDPIAYPEGWTSGTPISGDELWPGAAVDASGTGIAWPGWTELANGQWVIDPAAPFYDLRADAVVEFRVNPSTATTIVYPGGTGECAPTQPTPGTNPPGTDPTHPAGTPRAAALASAGFDGGSLLPIGGALALLGLVLMLGAARRRGNSTNEG